MTISYFLNKGLLKLTIFLGFYIITTHVFGQKQLDAKRVVFLKEIPVLFDLKKDTSIKRFTPTTQDIDSIDILLTQYFLQINSMDSKHLFITDYYRQYVGLCISGKKRIFINASCNQPDYFLKNTYYPKGGGHCYFRTLVDLDDKKVSEFYFNAPK